MVAKMLIEVFHVLCAYLQGLVTTEICLGAEVRRSCARSSEMTGKDRLDEGAEDDLGATARPVS